ncbi:sphingosine hydroxylase [Rhodocollybia butyracea]|uniref:Sphingosine hydroxylase n=1 Tax=Rhodocollybia butyracea TaxID=206335 RepID=A0A9P5PW47_9AGAR|nr:sphingosine hydroxylase [Rhodocollybia butyracea]
MISDTGTQLNTSSCLSSQLTSITYPIYYITRPNVFPGMSNQFMVAAVPFIIYWATSLIFHVLDLGDWKWSHKYKNHDSTEVQRNLASRWDVVKAVILQQITQVFLGSLLTAGDPVESTVKHALEMQNIALAIFRTLHCLMSSDVAEWTSNFVGKELAHYVYWWVIPIAQLGMFVMDTWQYFLHRAFHSNKFLYKHVHSMHHRLFAPWAYGAWYNHPLEGLLDSMGAVLSGAVAGLSNRQTILFFSISACKAVDDHSGYNLPWDPFKILSANTPDFHDIHHQVNGMKFNFSQPFFIHWDIVLGTRITRKELQSLKVQEKKAA